MTILEFQNEIARIVGEIPRIGQASCFPVAESDAGMVGKIEEQINTIGLSCLIMTPDIDTDTDSDMVRVERLIIGFTEIPLTNRTRQGAVTALGAACIVRGVFRRELAETAVPLRITQRASQDGGAITAELTLRTSFELTTGDEAMA